MLHERIPDSGRHFHLVRSKRLKAKLESLALALRVPDLERLLPVARDSQWNLRTANRADRRCERVAVEQVNKSKSCCEFRNGLALAEHRGSIRCNQRVANGKHFAQPCHGIRPVVIRIPSW